MSGASQLSGNTVFSSSGPPTSHWLQRTPGKLVDSLSKLEVVLSIPAIPVVIGDSPDGNYLFECSLVLRTF